MIEKTILIFTEKEEESVRLLTDIGVKRNVARLLVYISALARVSSHDIEWGTGLRQPEVSLALKYMVERGWVGRQENLKKSKGRPVKIWSLVLPFDQILDLIIIEKQQELIARLKRVRSVRDSL